MIASACFSSAYIGNEPSHADKLAISIQAAEEKIQRIYPIPKSTVLPQDMKLALQTYRRLRVSACGIEDCILPSQQYRAEVENQIARILPPDGLFISFSRVTFIQKGLH